MTEVLMITVTLQLRKIAIEKRASHASSNPKPYIDFQKLVDKLEQAEITFKLEKTENLKVQFVGNIQRKNSQLSMIQDSDIELPEKITQLLNIYKKKSNFKISHLSKTVYLLS